MVIARLNSRSRKKNAAFNANGDREAVVEFNKLTGYVDADNYHLSEEFMIRSPITFNYGQEENVQQAKAENDGNVDNDDDNDNDNVDVAMANIYISDNDEEETIEFYEDKRNNDLVLATIDATIDYRPPDIEPMNAEKSEWSWRIQQAVDKIEQNFADVTEKCAAAKKEMLFYKAVHEFGIC